MSGHSSSKTDRNDTAPGDTHRGSLGQALLPYGIGLVLAVGMTAASFFLAGSHLIWAQGIPVALLVLAVAQMGVHLVFFLHIGTGPDNTNNIMALAFGVLIVGLLIGGTLWIMANLDQNLMPMQPMSMP